MNQLDTDPEDLTRLLHERVVGVEPDLAERAAAGVRTGHRIRRRRQVGAAAGSVVGVAAIVGLGLALSPGSDPSDSVGPAFADDPTSAPPSSQATPEASPSSSPTQPAGQILPVSLAAPGWECAPPADEKFICTKGGDTVLVTVRSANTHDDYLHNPSKTSPDQFVSDVHHGVFATVVRPPGSTTDLAVLGAALAWTAQ